MEKTAQERGMLNKLREKINLSGRALEAINPEFSDLMDDLRSADEKIRQHAEQVKPSIRAAKSLVRRRDYLGAAVNLSAFHEKCRFVSAELQKFINSIDMKHYKFLLNQFDDEQKEMLFGYDPSKEINLEENAADDIIATASIKKLAGVKDWWFSITDPIGDLASNLSTSRGRAMRAFENKFDVSFLKNLKIDTARMADSSEKFLSFLIGIFKQLATAVATRNLNVYVKYAKEFINKFGHFHTQFIKYHKERILPLKEQQDKMNKEIEEAQRKELELHRKETLEKEEKEKVLKRLQDQAVAMRAQQEARKVQTVPGKAPSVLDMLEKKHGPVSNFVAKPSEQKKNEDNIPLDLTKKKADFISQIEKFASNNDYKNVISSILKFSEELEDSSSDESLKLLAIAEGMMDDYKKAGIFDFFKKKDDNEQEEDQVEAQEVPEIKKQRAPKLSPPPSPLARPVVHTIPDGRLNSKFSSVPALAKIKADNVRISPGAANHIFQIIAKRFYDYGFDDDDFDSASEARIINELKNAVVRSIVLTVSPSEDIHNPQDKQLELYTYINLNNISSMEGNAKLKILCRFLAVSGTVSVRTIQKNFLME